MLLLWKAQEDSALKPPVLILKLGAITLVNCTGFNVTALGAVTSIASTFVTLGGFIDNKIVGVSGAIFIGNEGSFIPTFILGVGKLIVIVGALANLGSDGLVGGVTLISTGSTCGNTISVASIGLFTFGFISGFTTALGIVIVGVMLISSLNTDFGRTLAIICISTSGSWTCKSPVSP